MIPDNDTANLEQQQGHLDYMADLHDQILALVRQGRLWEEMSLIKALIVCLAIVVFSTMCRADSLDSIVSRSQSTDSDVRIDAFAALQPYLKQNPIDPRAVAAVTGLLVLETNTPDGSVDEDGPYFSNLITAVVNLNETSTIPSLLDVICSGDIVPRRLAQYGTAALGPVLALATDQNWTVRKCVMITLEYMLSPQNSSSVSDPQSMAKITAALGHGSYRFESVCFGVSPRGRFKLLAPATALLSGNACNGVYGGTFNGNVNVSPGQNCIIINGSIAGNVQGNGGNLILSGTLITGNVQINGNGTFSVGPSTTINGNLRVQNIPSGNATNQICDATVKGDLQFENNGTAVQIGSPSPSCVGNIIGGNLQVQNNTASMRVFINIVGNNLQCQQNSSITGSGNTAGQKQGQCAAF